jgi:hypothetical protein
MIATVINQRYQAPMKTFEEAVHGRPPKNAIRNRKTKDYIMGANGTYYTYHKSKYILYFQTNDGNIYEKDIMPYIKDTRPGIIVREKVIGVLYKSFKDKEFNAKLKNGELLIDGIYSYLDEIL